MMFSSLDCGTIPKNRQIVEGVLQKRAIKKRVLNPLWLCYARMGHQMGSLP